MISEYYRRRGGNEKIHVLGRNTTFSFGEVFVAETRDMRLIHVPLIDDNWIEISKEEFVENGTLSVERLGGLHPVISEFAERFDFHNVRIVYPDKYRFSQVRALKEEKIPLDIVHFKEGVEDLSLQIEGALGFTNLIFADIAMDKVGEKSVCRITHPSGNLYMLTENSGYIEFGKKFILEFVHV